MDSVITKLSGNLGERHRCFNALVHEAHSQSTSLSLQTRPDESALDRLFKIDLASKQRNVEFIIHTLKDDDMLYVNRTLKSLWLLEPEYSNIINPIFLEHELVPHMILPAVNKLRHWIQMHLRDPQRCKEFHQFYKERDVDVATNFLWHCTNEYVLYEIGNVLEKITPKLLKRLSEKVPRITKMYYDSLKHNQTLLKYYLKNDSKFFANLKYLLKTDADVFFHVLENFFVPQKFAQLSAAITKYIMKHHKCRFLWKPELYTAWFLDMATLARCLSSEEIKDLVLKLARAEYLQSWFSFQRVELLIKHIKKEERGTFKTLIFVDKAFAPMVKEWQYPIPVPPVLTTPQKGLFDDAPSSYRPVYFYFYGADTDDYRDEYVKKSRPKTLLDDLFEKYRFFNYEQTFTEIQKQLGAESSAKNRQFMLLVLVSKTGGRIENMVHLLDLLYQHKNEPVQIRATILRSLVKRACVWRLPPEHWRRLLEWGHGLGLDGNTPEAICCEGRDAIVIRDLLAGLKPNATVWNPYNSRVFNNLHEYPFNAEERSCIRARLPALLLAEAQASKPDNYNMIIILKNLLDTLQAYHVKFDELPGVVETVLIAFRCKERTWHPCVPEGPGSFLTRLYDAGVERKHLIKDYFEVLQTDESYVNALRHDISILDDTDKLEKLIDKTRLKHDKFFRKLALYFMEKDGLGERYRAVLARRAAMVVENPLTRNRRDGYSKWGFSGGAQGRPIIAMPLTILSGSTFILLLSGLDTAPPKSSRRQLAAALRANAHIVRPPINLESFGWHKAGVKAIANRLAVCRQRDTDQYLQQCLTWQRTLRLALVLGKRVNKERDVFELLANERPGTALQAALLYFRRERTNPDIRIWDMVKSHILKIACRQRRLLIDLTHTVPAIIKAEYCFLVYMAFKNDTPHFRCKAFSLIPALLPEIDEQYIFDAINGFMSDRFKDYETVKSMINVNLTKGYPYYLADAESRTNETYIMLYIEVIAKFLILSTSEEQLEERYRTVALPFLNRLELFWKHIPQKDVPTESFLNLFLYYLRYNKVYFDVNYVSCLPVLERITDWMQGFLPIEKWFEKYVETYLTMIYFKSARHCLEQNPELIAEANKLKGSQMMGTIFGKYVANEIDELTQKYFLSITELYGSSLLSYYTHYIDRKNDECFEKFTVAFINALITNNSGASCILAKYVFVQFRDRFKSDHVNDILKLFKDSGVNELRVF